LGVRDNGTRDCGAGGLGPCRLLGAEPLEKEKKESERETGHYAEMEGGQKKVKKAEESAPGGGEKCGDTGGRREKNETKMLPHKRTSRRGQDERQCRAGPVVNKDLGGGGAAGGAECPKYATNGRGSKKEPGGGKKKLWWGGGGG